MKTFTHVRSIANLLRLAAISMFLSGVTFFLPETWIDSFLASCGLEQMPHVRLMRYVLLAAGMLQVGIGVVVWVIARDVVRYQPVVVAVLAAFLAGAPAFYLVGAIAGMPRWWCIVDFTCFFLAGGVPLAFCLWPSSPNHGVPANHRPAEQSDGSGNFQRDHCNRSASPAVPAEPGRYSGETP